MAKPADSGVPTGHRTLDQGSQAAPPTEAGSLDDLDISESHRFRDDTVGPLFARMRCEAPVHYCKQSRFGPYWSLTRYADIVAVERDTELYSSASGFAIADVTSQGGARSFLGTDPPEHRPQRRAIEPMMAASSVAELEDLARERVRCILDSLPTDDTFDWVPAVAVRLTIEMLTTMLGIPIELAPQLHRWADLAAVLPAPGEVAETSEERDLLLAECYRYFLDEWERKKQAPPRFDFISMLAHTPATRSWSDEVFLLNLLVLIVGGNDTTRSSISGGVLLMAQHPEQRALLDANPSLVRRAVSEIIRYQTPLTHMRRTLTRDTVLHGQQLRKGDKLVLWYLSANRDESEIADPERFTVTREAHAHHLSFGAGPHRCVGSTVAEMQLRVLWEELIARRWHIELAGTPARTDSCFVHGFTSMPVRIRQM